jgi:hypothetical protein
MAGPVSLILIKLHAHIENRTVGTGPVLRHCLNLLILLCLLSGCATSTKPDLQRLYQQSREVNQPPIVVIHGIMGSRLEDSVSGEDRSVKPVKT